MSSSQNEVVRSYELTYLLPATYTEGDATQVKTDLANLVKKYQGTIVETQEWGRKPMAYTITFEGKKHRDAIYVHQALRMPAIQAPLFEHDLYLNGKIMRHLFLVTEQTKDVVFSYKNLKSLLKYTTEYRVILPRAKTGLTQKLQKKLTREIKYARHLALLPFTQTL